MIYIIYCVLEKTLHLKSNKMKSHHEGLVLISKLEGSKAMWVKLCALNLDVCGFTSELTCKLPVSLTLSTIFNHLMTKFPHKISIKWK